MSHIGPNSAKNRCRSLIGEWYVSATPWGRIAARLQIRGQARALEPIQEEVESHESVVILYWRLIREGAPDVET